MELLIGKGQTMNIEVKKLMTLFITCTTLGMMLIISSCQVDQAVLQKAAGAAGIANISSLSISQGNVQNIAQNSQAPQELEVIALDTNGNAASGLSVKFQIVTTDGGFLEASGTTKNVTTGPDGKASVSYTSGSFAGQVSIVASAYLSSVTFIQNISAQESSSSGSSGSTLLLVKGINQTVAINASAPEELEVLALNSAGAPMPDVPVTFEVYTPSAGKLTGDVVSKTVNTSAAGKANVIFSALTRLGQATIIATSSAGSAAFSVNVIDPDSTANGSSGSTLLIVKGNNQPVAKNSSATDDLEVMAFNSAGAPMEAVAVTFEVFTAGSGTLTGGVTTKVVNTLANGKASVAFSALGNLGSATIIATSSAGSAAFNVSVIDTTSGSTSFVGATLLMVKGNNNLVEQNSNTTLEVLALDSTGLPIENMDVTFEVLTSGSIDNPLPSTGTSSGGGLAAKTGSNGRASVVFTAPSSLGTATIIARSGAGSAAFNLSVGVQGIGSTLSISNGNGQVIIPNTLASEDLEVIATSASGGPLSGITVTFTVTTNNGGILSNSQGIYVTTTDSNGKAFTTFTSSNTSGPISILASSSVGSANFALNTSSNSSGGGGSSLSFAPTSLSPSSGIWLQANVGSNPAKSVTLVNTTSHNIFINSVFTTSLTPFSIFSDNCPRSPNPLASGADCTISIQFSPTSGETVSKFLFVNWSNLSDGSNGDNAVLSLEGSGPPVLTFNGISNIDNVTTESLRVSWNAATGGTVTQYRVYRLISGVPNLVATLPSGTTSYSTTGLAAGTTYTYRVRSVNTANEEDGNTADVSATTASLSLPVIVMDGVYNGNFLYPVNPKLAGSLISIDFKNSSTGNDTGSGGSPLTYTCKFSRVVTGLPSGKSNCTSSNLGPTYSLNPATGFLNWTPPFGTQGVFEFLISGTDTNGSGLRYFTMHVGHPYASPNLSTLLAEYRATFADMTGSHSGSASYWQDVTGFGNTATISGSPMWAGASSNTSSDPQRFTLGNSTEINLGGVLAGYDRFMIDYWISNPEATFTNNSVVLKMDSEESDNGFKITQTTLDNGQRALKLDFERSYSRVVLNDSPAAYWRMDEASGNRIDDLAGSNDLIFSDSANTPTVSGLSYGLSGATLGETSSKAISTHTNRLVIPNNSTFKPSRDVSVEMWVRYNSRTTPNDHDLYSFSTTSTSSGLSLSILSGVLTLKYKPNSSSTVTLTTNNTGYGHLFDQNWHHIVFVYSFTNSIKALYLDGNILASSTATDGDIVWPSTPDSNWVTANGDPANPVQIDEVAFYNYSLSTNQIRTHLAAGDHYNRNQNIHPANGQFQSRPLGFWRFGEAQANIAQDYSGNQQDIINKGGTLYRSTGVYQRTGGSNIDTDGSTYHYFGCSVNQYENKVYNNRRLNFDRKLTYSTWVNFNSYGGNYPVFFSINNNSTNWFALVFGGDTQGRLRAWFNANWNGTNPEFAFVNSASQVIPSSTSTNLPLGWYHLTMTYDGTQNANNRVQFYINGTAVKMATPGGNSAVPSTLSSLSGSAWDFEVGTWATNSGCWGSINQYPFDEAAIYDRILSANEIRAQAFEASLRSCSVPVTTLLQDPYNSKPFDHLNMLFDGTKISVYRNSKLECALRPSINLSSDALDLKVGATSNGFQGHISDFRVHGSAGTTVASTADAYTTFIQSSDQHRLNPLGNIIKTKLVRAFEPSSAFDGVRPYSPGSELSKIQWSSVGSQPSDIRQQEPAYLRNFTNTGWNGTGTSTDPYRLSFDGIDDFVDLGTTPVMRDTTNKMSVCMWAKTTQTSTFSLFHRGDNGSNNGWGDFHIVQYNNQNFYLLVNHASTGGSYIDAFSNFANFRNGQWHYICGTYNGSSITLFMDGNIIAGPLANTSTMANNSSQTSRMTLGTNINWTLNQNQYGGFFNGDMGGVHIYNDGLTQAQVKQNCSAQVAMYSGATCAP